MATTKKEILTIAKIRKSKRKEETEYLFNESAQIFMIKPSLLETAAPMDGLKKAFKNQAPVMVQLDRERGRIRKIYKDSPEKMAAFVKERVLLPSPNKPNRVNLKKINPATFNVVDHYLKVPTFKLCKKIIPNYTVAKNIFDFCADQSCHLPGPYDISPCIPFQYVRDGCYARAHKMRRVITKKYGYCCEKVFSFANQNNDRLAVTADKWGGCCVTWWYHVAPLVRVRFRIPKFSRKSLTLALVIDPGMFDKPVLLSSWLAAQEKVICSANANVSMYSIQAGSAYAPANYAGTAFSKDPGYTKTDATLTAYSALTTCP